MAWDIEDYFERSKTYESFRQQPGQRKSMIEILFGILAHHPTLRIEAAWVHEDYGFMCRLANSQRHIVYQNDGTLIMESRYSHHDPISVGFFGPDTVRDCVVRMEAARRGEAVV